MARVGTCSWADRSMVEAWYPEDCRSPEDLLRHYSRHFDVVEVNSTFYALPQAGMAEGWAERTPENFTFHVKAFGVMTGHSVPPDRLPDELREEYDYELTRYGNVKNPPPQMIRRCFALFCRALRPLQRARKLGLILFQFPPYFTARHRGELRRNLRWIDRSAEVMQGYDLAVEFRHRSWYRDDVMRAVLPFLRERQLSLVAADEPQVGDRSIPPVVLRSGPYGYFRLHGRNETNWNRRTSSAAERFRYLYSEEELREWVEPIRELERETEETFVMFNNCYADYAPRNALDMMGLLGQDGRD